MEEPSVLDYIKSLFTHNSINIFDYLDPGDRETTNNSSSDATSDFSPNPENAFLIGIFLALAAQLNLEFSVVNPLTSLLLYSISGIIFWRFLYSNFHNECTGQKFQPESKTDLIKKPIVFYLSIGISIAAFFTFKNNKFTIINTSLWIAAILLFGISVWESGIRKKKKATYSREKILLLILVSLLCVFFRTIEIGNVPNEMFSDHAEKLLDVMDVLDGSFPIFFPRNTGREALQFYLTSLLIRLFNIEIGFISLKIGTVIAGLLALPFIFLLGDYLFGYWVGFCALFFAGISYWLNVISRIGLRFPFYPLFTAPLLYFLIKGLNERSFKSTFLAGIFLGFGLHGYSPFRIVPFLVSIIFLIFWLSRYGKREFQFTLNSFFLISLSSLLIFLPLLRFFVENPSIVAYRSLSRLTGIENTIEGNKIAIFLKNLWDALAMFFHNNGDIWVISIPGRPALGVVSAIFFFIGLLMVLVEIKRIKNWKYISLLASIPVLLLPSVLSLAYPGENPALNRSSAAAIPVFIISAFGFVSSFKLFFDNRTHLQKKIVKVITVLLLVISILQNYYLVFDKFSFQFSRNAWNTSEIGAEIQKFTNTGGDPDNVFVIPYPHWVDTRLVGINAGFPRKDYALWREDIPDTIFNVGDKIFFVKPEDQESIHTLESLYPKGGKEIFISSVPGKNFVIFRVTK